MASALSDDPAPSASLGYPKAQAAPAPPGAPPPPRGGSPRPSPPRLTPLQGRGSRPFQPTQAGRLGGWLEHRPLLPFRSGPTGRGRQRAGDGIKRPLPRPNTAPPRPPWTVERAQAAPAHPGAPPEPLGGSTMASGARLRPPQSRGFSNLQPAGEGPAGAAALPLGGADAGGRKVAQSTAARLLPRPRVRRSAG